MSSKLIAPFPYIGGKSSVTSMVWSRFGNVRTYIEPFAGSMAILLDRPPCHFDDTIMLRELANDKAGLVVNTWRAIQYDPDGFASYIIKNAPVFELDLLARQKYLISIEESLSASLEEDPEFYDLKVATYWISGLSSHVTGANYPTEISNRRPRVASFGKGIHSPSRLSDLDDLLAAIAARLRHVKILCGDWSRTVTEPAMEADKGLVGVFLDPPYTKGSGRSANLYDHDDFEIGHEVFEWCMRYGESKNIRIALCGLEGEYEIPSTWESVAWKAQGASKNADLERIWFSPHCIDPTKQKTGLFANPSWSIQDPDDEGSS